MKTAVGFFVAVAFVAACAHNPPSPDPVAAVAPGPSPAPAPPPAVDYAAIVAAPDRTDADRALDAGRKPAELLAFFQIQPGQRVAELAAGGGYTTELLARTVGPSGVVYGENPKWVLDKFAAGPWADRLARPVDANVVRLDREMDDPFGPDIHDLDAVLIVLFYHDSVWSGVDRAKMNSAVYAALRPGGTYGIVDHVAKDGDGIQDVQTLHRIEPSVILTEVEAAGFKLDGEADFLRNPEDAHDWNPNPGSAGARRGTSDRVVLRFRK